MVIRNSKGVVLGSKVIINENIPSVFTAEVIACLQSLMFGLDLGFSKIEVKGDPLAGEEFWEKEEFGRGNEVTDERVKAYGKGKYWLPKRLNYYCCLSGELIL
ncbi:hypothetical protein Goshw_004836 [Gossypium schwendimanii]|uniref:RNase H type-1 domain-containing protein n=1 Tax=Gossypium schwendimanii TaxID=34291 RepID=A0A7J9L8P2_GOSSC|nr:hypothetical protein [Gossypium schwendimanii]